MPTREEYQALWDAQKAPEAATSDADYYQAIDARHEAERTFNAAAEAELDLEPLPEPDAELEAG